MFTRTRTRGGFTLVELLVAVTIIAVLAAITALYFPRFQDKEVVGRAADQLQMYLLSAKQMARRDGVPTGLRFPVETDASGRTFVRQILYVQQRPDFAQGVYTGVASTSPLTLQFSLPKDTSKPNGYMEFGDEALPVAKDDFIEIYGVGVPHRIANIVSDPSPPSPVPANVKWRIQLVSDSAVPPTPDTKPVAGQSPVNYRIISQPNVIPGEQPLTLPEYGSIRTAIDLTSNPNLTMFVPTDRVVTRNLPKNGNNYEIIFSPGGSVMGQGSTGGQVILWVRDMGDTSKPKDNRVAGGLRLGNATLVTVQMRTGFIGAHDVATGSDPYAFTKDGRSSGM